MNDAAKTFLTALAAVASAAIIAILLADHVEPPRPTPSSSQHWATQTLPGPQADQASRPRG